MIKNSTKLLELQHIDNNINEKHIENQIIKFASTNNEKNI